MITLHEKHIDHLYEFTRKHFVYWHDLQTELVDHLASGIEELSAENPERSFEELLQMQFAKFGVHGFEDVISNRRKALTRVYSRMVLKRIGRYFQWPVILKSITFIIMLYYALTWFQEDWFVYSILTGIAVMAIVGFVRISIRKNKIEYYRNKKWLLQDIIMEAGGSAVLFIFPIQIVNFLFDDMISYLDHFGFRLGLAVFLVLYVKALQIVCWVLPGQIDEILAERYSDYKYAG